MRRILLALLLLSPFCSFATHIVGGTITYEHINGDTYSITVLLYRDCTSPTTPFPASVNVQVRDANGNQLSPTESFNSQLDSVLPVPSYMSACVVNPGICIEEGYYTSVVTLAPLAGGYHVFHQFCCRTNYLNNVTNPIATGLSLYAFIPDANTQGVNTSANWNLQPPLFECQGFPMNYDNGAFDADGDSLVFTYYTPYSDPAPTFPSGVATFTPLTWAAGYGANNPCGGPNLTMNNMGYITGTPGNIGYFQSGIRCEEYRNGVKISEVNRDYPFIVVSCTPAPQAQLPGPTISCYQNTVGFQHFSTNATSFHWDFGDPAIGNDTSNLANPQWLYANPGTYTVTLVVQPYTACADTDTMVLTVEQVFSWFTPNDTLFSSVSNQFFDSSWTSDGTPIIMWDWDFGDMSPHATVQNPTHVYASTGTYTVTLVVLSATGCLDTVVFAVYVDLVNNIEAFGQLPFRVYPNPSEGIFNVYVPFTTGTLRLTDLQGREIARYNVNGQTLLTLNLGNEAGTYLLEFNSGEVKLVRKLVVE
jgi:PKD repeat protein